MGYEWEAGNGADEDIEVILNIGNGATNPRIKYDSLTAKIQFSHDGETFENMGVGEGSSGENITWENPGRWGVIRYWPDTDAEVLRWKWGSNGESMADGVEIAQFGDFLRL